MEDFEDNGLSPLSVPPYPYISSTVTAPKHTPMWPQSSQPRIQDPVLGSDVFADDSKKTSLLEWVYELDITP